MSFDRSSDLEVSAEVERRLDRGLAAWARARRLDADDLASIRAQVLARVAEPVADLEPEPMYDSDWLWSLLRPMTALMEQTPSKVSQRVSERVERWLQPLSGGASYKPYLRLA